MIDSIKIASPSETLAYGKALGESAQPGDVVCLLGDLGAGKTLLTQGIGLGLGLPSGSVVNSPTFTLVSEHAGGRLELYHFDLYRLDGKVDLANIGAEEYFEGHGLCVIEWANRAPDALPADRLEIRIEFGEGDEEREFHTTANGPQSLALLGAVSAWKGQ